MPALNINKKSNSKRSNVKSHYVHSNQTEQPMDAAYNNAYTNNYGSNSKYGSKQNRKQNGSTNKVNNEIADLHCIGEAVNNEIGDVSNTFDLVPVERIFKCPVLDHRLCENGKVKIDEPQFSNVAEMIGLLRNCVEDDSFDETVGYESQLDNVKVHSFFVEIL